MLNIRTFKLAERARAAVLKTAIHFPNCFLYRGNTSLLPTTTTSGYLLLQLLQRLHAHTRVFPKHNKGNFSISSAVAASESELKFFLTPA